MRRHNDEQCTFAVTQRNADPCVTKMPEFSKQTAKPLFHCIQICLRVDITLGRRFLEPFFRLGFVSGHAFT